jgi:cytochrome P450
VSKVTLDIICDTAFGYTSDSLRNPDNELTHAYETLLSLQSGRNLVRFTAVVSIPFMAAAINSRFGPTVARLLSYLPPFGSEIETLGKSAYKIRSISRQILKEKAVAPEDRETKKDIMSLLVRARKGETKDGYRLSDEALVDQVVSYRIYKSL